jgi:hypothetical protein
MMVMMMNDDDDAPIVQYSNLPDCLRRMAQNKMDLATGRADE